MTMTRRELLRNGGFAIAGGLFGLSACSAPPSAAATSKAQSFEIMRSDAQWRERLTPAQYRTLRQEGTERPYSSPLNSEHRKGTFACAGCALPLFASTTKFESGTGWPSFYAPLPKAVGETRDVSLGMARTEVHCRRCGGHLGHVFNDGQRPTGLRYCMNGAAMTFATA
ncbi:MAG: peptide-methionine (R)-S-oxide reductase MsrB [Pseudoxanthomonas sp.]